MKNKNPYKAIWSTISGGLIGLAVSVIMIYFVKGEIDLGLFFGGIAGLSIFVFFNLRSLRKKKDSTPEIDERIEKNLNKFRSVVGSSFLLAIALTLIILFILDIRSIDLSYIWMALLLYIFIVGFGSMVVRRH